MGFVAWAGSAVKTNNAINTLRTPHQKMPHIFDPILDDGPVLSGTLANPQLVGNLSQWRAGFNVLR